MTKEKSDAVMRMGIIKDTFDAAYDAKNFVRKLNKDGTKFEKLGGGWGKLVGPRTGSYGQN